MTSKEKNAFRKTSRWTNFRKYLVEKRENKCEICQMYHKKGLHLHHHDPNNYTTLNESRFSVLCSSCHRNLLERILKRKEFDIDLLCENLKRIYKESK